MGTRLSVRRAVLCAVAVVIAMTGFAPPAAAERYVHGAPGLGDPFFPDAGNGGYDVRHYELEIAYDPATQRLDGTAVIRARATQNLDRFNLDLRGFLAVSRVAVGDDRRLKGASFTREGQELVISPRPKLKDGERFRVLVDYSGTAEPIVDPDESIEGFIPTDDGAFVVCEPQGAPGWYPANDNPQDKARFDISVTVPAGLTALANGVLVSSATRGGKTTWVWHHENLMAPYLATATLGRFDLTRSTLPDGTPSYVAVDPRFTNRTVLERIPEIQAFFGSLYGQYPFDATGAIVDFAPHVGYALETQTKANYSRMPSEGTLVHELAHEWFGNSVTLSQWPDIWLHEGFAAWSEWIWDEHVGAATAHEAFLDAYSIPAGSSFWSRPPAALGSPVFLFSNPPYLRGAMTLQALREKIGDVAFFGLMRGWATRNRYGNVTTAEFIAAAEQQSGMNLNTFFDVWLFQPGKPTTW
jgi:aminopeptidase N